MYRLLSQTMAETPGTSLTPSFFPAANGGTCSDEWPGRKAACNSKLVSADSTLNRHSFHPENVVLCDTEMKRTISAAGKPIFFIKKLTKQFIQRNLPCCKNTQVPVHGEKVVGGTDSQCRSNRYRFLSDDGEPVTYYILS